MTTQELEDKWRKEAEKVFPHFPDGDGFVDELSPFNISQSLRQDGYIACASSRQAEVESLTKERDESRENYESLMRSSLVVGEEYRENINALTKELAERDQLALEFADYLENERWKYDHKEQVTHTIQQHWEYFKSLPK